MNSNPVTKFHKDKSLILRMYFTVFMLGVLYSIFSLFLLSAGIPLTFIFLIVGAMVVFQYYTSDKLVLKSTGAKIIDEQSNPKLFSIVRNLANNYNMPMPKVAIIDSMVPNAFATGRNSQNSVVAVTKGIIERLTELELRAVLGHELAHVANQDMKVLAIANFLTTLTSFLMTMFFWNMMFGGMGRTRNNSSGGIMIIYLVTMLVYFLGQILVLSLTRHREYGADHTGSEITGDPESLANALEKISGSLARIPDQDLRKFQTANAFLIIPSALKGEGSMNLFSTHPPTEERVKRLRNLKHRF
ncbi:MAG: zinc metalloprotease HtpX [Chloroflexi bacterium]|nr:zinc metalloprotease HtpX [Chloroflexota bacterium]